MCLVVRSLVCAGNAKPMLKEVTAFTTATNAEDGVAKAIHEFALPRAPANVPRKRDFVRKWLSRAL